VTARWSLRSVITEIAVGVGVACILDCSGRTSDQAYSCSVEHDSWRRHIDVVNVAQVKFDWVSRAALNSPRWIVQQASVVRDGEPFRGGVLDNGVIRSAARRECDSCDR